MISSVTEIRPTILKVELPRSFLSNLSKLVFSCVISRLNGYSQFKVLSVFRDEEERYGKSKSSGSPKDGPKMGISHIYGRKFLEKHFKFLGKKICLCHFLTVVPFPISFKMGVAD